MYKTPRPAAALPMQGAVLVERIAAGDVGAAARLMRDLDDRVPSAKAALRLLFPRTGHAYVVGITGAPGAGKSSLTDRLIAHHRAAGRTVGVVAVDPTSPFSGGAILGDRIRMSDHVLDPGVFIRSLATRGHLGGLSRAAANVVQVMDAMGMDVVLVETVGVGQDEVEITHLAHTVVVVTVPGLGDDIQAIKAGILEIADVFVVNKADREGAERTARDLRFMLELRRSGSARAVPDHDHLHATASAPGKTEAEGASCGDWDPPVIMTVALRNQGIEALALAVEAHRKHLDVTGERRRREHDRARTSFISMLRERLLEEAVDRLADEEGRLEDVIERIASRRADPYELIDQIAARLSAPR